MKDRCEMFVGGRSIPPKVGGYFAVENSATGETACQVAEGKAEDIERAVKSAGRRSKMDAGRGWNRASARGY